MAEIACGNLQLLVGRKELLTLRDRCEDEAMLTALSILRKHFRALKVERFVQDPESYSACILERGVPGRRHSTGSGRHPAPSVPNPLGYLYRDRPTLRQVVSRWPLAERVLLPFPTSTYPFSEGTHTDDGTEEEDGRA